MNARCDLGASVAGVGGKCSFVETNMLDLCGSVWRLKCFVFIAFCLAFRGETLTVCLYAFFLFCALLFIFVAVGICKFQPLAKRQLVVGGFKWNAAFKYHVGDILLVLTLVSYFTMCRNGFLQNFPSYILNFWS